MFPKQWVEHQRCTCFLSSSQMKTKENSIYCGWQSKDDLIHVRAVDLNIYQLLRSRMSENLNVIQASHELWKKKTIMCASEVHR